MRRSAAMKSEVESARANHGGTGCRPTTVQYIMVTLNVTR
jgi:hypothetical protein